MSIAIESIENEPLKEPVQKYKATTAPTKAFNIIKIYGEVNFDIKNKTICIKVLCKYNEHEKADL